MLEPRQTTNRPAFDPGSSARRLVDERYDHERQPFLASHRALAACAREFARLSNEVLHGLAESAGPNAEDKVVVRRSPDRCIVQLGPVALTMAWLRNTHDSVATGELLVIGWRGVVAPRQTYQPERPLTGPAPLGATLLWEEVLAAVADSEESWTWQPRGVELGRCSSTELAARCVQRLCVAYLEGRDDA
jgi:hypothetical protein